jgi:hypothetical protein
MSQNQGMPVCDNRFKIPRTIKVVGNISTFRLNNVDVNYEEVKCEKDEIVDRNIFILNLIKKRYKDINTNEHFIEWNKKEEVIGIKLLINSKETLFKFHLTENKKIFSELRGNSREIHLEVGIIDSIEKMNFFKNKFYEIIKAYKKGISNEFMVVSAAKLFAEENNYTIIQSFELDDTGVDFVLKDNFFGTEFYFQVKSSLEYVKEAIEKGKGFYNKKEIIFIVASGKKNIDDFYSIIAGEIKDYKK